MFLLLMDLAASAARNNMEIKSLCIYWKNVKEIIKEEKDTLFN